MNDRKSFAQDGFVKVPNVLTEGYVRKGGVNPPTAQTQPRPAPPAPLQPTSGPNAPATAPSASESSTKSGS
jgi:hypothetical protein